MTEIKALDELREIAADINASEIVDHMELYPSCVFDGAWLDAWHNEFYRIIARLEAEIAGRFVELPADEEGCVLRIGDEMKLGNGGEGFFLNGLVWNGRRWYATGTMASSDWHPVHLCRHVRPRRIEDVLREFVEYVTNGTNVDSYEKDIADYADEIRGIMEKGEDR